MSGSCCKRFLHCINVLCLFSDVSLVRCEVPQLTIEQNKDDFCPGETARLICTWKDLEKPALTWIVNGTKTTGRELSNIPGRSVNSSILGGYTIVSISQTEHSLTTYACLSSTEDVLSETVNVNFQGICWLMSDFNV